MIVGDLTELDETTPSVVVVGSGPAGLVVALELRRLGVDVTIVESGADGFDEDRQRLADAEIIDKRRHAPMRMAVRRSLGGTSLLWGGRCVPFDDVDFIRRPQVRYGGWPIGHDEIRPWYDRAGKRLDSGQSRFLAPSPAAARMAECSFQSLERWSNTPNLRNLHAAALSNDAQLRVCTNATAVDLDIDLASGRVLGIVVVTPSRRRVTRRGRAYVLACGGLETTRLLLTTQTRRPGLFGGSCGVLGRFYMGHLSGRIADIVLTDPMVDSLIDYFSDDDGRYVRRRFTINEDVQRRYDLLNFAAWPDNPQLDDPAHESALLSLAYLALATPIVGSRLAPEGIRRAYLPNGVANVGRHFTNVLGDVPGAAYAAARFLHGRYLAKVRIPGFFVRSAARRYAFHYHAEQAPNDASVVTLSSDCDALGMPQLRIDLRYSDLDASSVSKCHDVIDRNLREAGIGHLEYTTSVDDRSGVILANGSDGFHQIGTTRMAADPRRGVVDANCRVHGAPNLFIASSSVFPTSGQANPTLLLAALSARLAAHLHATALNSL
jgi:choline dehydrogenase-like flavoprotein